jgi:hypothetical protein
VISKAIAGLLFFACGAFVSAQPAGLTIAVSPESLPYPLLANLANIQGDVGFEVSAAETRLVTGSPILVPAARKNLDEWILPPLEYGRYLVRFHFNLTGEMTQVTVPIVSKRRRFFLRLIGAATTTRIAQRICERGSKTSVQQSITRDGNDVIIDIFVTSPYECGNID